MQYSLVNIVWYGDAVFTSEYCSEYCMGMQYSLVNIVWDTVFTSEYCMGIQYSLVNIACMGYNIH